MSKITAADVDALNEAARQAMAAMPVPEVELDESSLALPDTLVRLPGGYLSDTGEILYEAEVRELNGHDEEALAKSPNMGRALLTILERGLVRIGSEKASKQILDDLLMGDRESILLGIRCATFGNTVDISRQCPFCGQDGTYRIDLLKEVPVVRLERPEDRVFTVTCRAGEVEVILPTGATHKDLLSNPDRSIAELNSKIMADCVRSVNGVPSRGLHTVKGLGMQSREVITQAISDRNPGPRLEKVTDRCGTCDREMPLALSMSALFRL